MRTTVRRTFRIIMVPARLFGLFPIFCDRRRRYRVSVPLLVLSVTMCMAYIVVTVVIFTTNIDLAEHIILGLQIDQLDMVLMNLVPILSICKLLCSLSDLNQSLFFLEAVDAQFLQLGKFVEYDTNKSTYLINSLLSLVASVSRLAKNAITNSVGMLQSAGQLLYNFSLLGHMVALVYWFFGVVGVTATLFTACNQELLLYSKDSVALKTKKLEKLIRAHHTLCLSSSLLDEIHGVQLVIIFITCFVISVSETYRCIELLMRELDGVTCLALVVKLCWVGVCFSLCFQLVTACRRCAAVAKEFNILLYQLMLDDKTNEILNNQKLRLHIAMKREVVFTACGFFKLDYHLIHSMTAAATIYLVILIQFGQPATNYTLLPRTANTTDGPISFTSLRI